MAEKNPDKPAVPPAAGQDRPGAVGSRIDQKAERFKRATSDTVERTRDSVDRAAERVERSMHRGTDKVADAADRTTERAAQARERGREAVDDVLEQANDWLDQARDYVREKPTQSVVIAVAAGWFLGHLMRR